MAKLTIKCPKCRARLGGVTTDIVGDIGVCPRCRAEFEIKDATGAQRPVHSSTARFEPIYLLPVVLVPLAFVLAFSVIGPYLLAATWIASYVVTVYMTRRKRFVVRAWPAAIWLFAAFVLPPVGLLIYLIVLFWPAMSDADYAEALVRQLNNQPATTQPPIRWRVLRVAAISLFVIGSLSVAFSLTLLIGRPPNSRHIGLSFVLFAGIGTVVSVLMTTGGLVWARLITRRDPRIGHHREKRIGGDLIAAIVAFVFYLVAVRHAFPESLQGLGALVAVVGSVYVVFSCKTFRWRNYVVAGTLPAFVVSSILIPATMTAQVRLEISGRTRVFDEAVRGIEGIITQDEQAKNILANGTDAPHRFGEIPKLDGGMLVLDAQSEDPSALWRACVSEVDLRLPTEFSAREPQELRVIVVFGRFGGQANRLTGRPTSIRTEVSVVAPILVYQWPEKRLLRAALFETGCTTAATRARLHTVAAKALVQFLQE